MGDTDGDWVPVLAEVQWREEGRGRQRPAVLRWGEHEVALEVEASWVVGPLEAGKGVVRRFMCRTETSPKLLYRITLDERTGAVRVEMTRVPPMV